MEKNNEADNEVVANSKGSTAVFDDVFRTMLDKIPEVVIPVINEVFNTSYGDNEKIIHLKNEHVSKNGKVITDSCIGIQNKVYHLECQSSPDSTMTLRMIEYDFAIALDNAQKREEFYEMEFPKSCVLYLRHTNRTSDKLKMKVRLPDGNRFNFEVPIVKVQKYTKDEIFQKRLLMFLPFYIMRYEKEFEEIESQPDKLISLLKEYEDIRNKLMVLLEENEKAVVYTDLIEMIIKISDYMLKKQELLKERIGKTMAGRVLKLFSERIAENQEDVAEYVKNMAQSGVDEAELAMLKAILTVQQDELSKQKAQIKEEERKIQEEKTKLAKQREELDKAYLHNDVKMYIKLINEKIIDYSKAIELTGLSEDEFSTIAKELGLFIEK